jgi:hypothetical protein
MKTFSNVIESLLIYVTHLTSQQNAAPSAVMKLNKVCSSVEVLALKLGRIAD